VKVDERIAASAPSLAEIRPIVLREWQSEQRRAQNKSFLDTLRSKYEVRVEGAAAGLFAAPTASGVAK
jgi:hypothetical protein